MAIEATLVLAFTGSKNAQEFSDWLFHNDYKSNTLFLNSVRVIVSDCRDVFAIREEANRRGGTIVEDDVRHGLG